MPVLFLNFYKIFKLVVQDMMVKITSRILENELFRK